MKITMFSILLPIAGEVLLALFVVGFGRGQKRWRELAAMLTAAALWLAVWALVAASHNWYPKTILRLSFGFLSCVTVGVFCAIMASRHERS